MTGRVRAVVREVALTAGAAAGALCLLFALLSGTVGVRTLTFTSGSMAPAIRTGDLAVTRPVPVGRIAVGDVVSVVDPRGVRVTHRVVAVDAARHVLRLRGDANRVADPLPYPADVVDRVVFAVPAGGTVLARLSGPTGTLMLGGYLAFLLAVLWPRRSRVTAGGLLLVAGLALGGAALGVAARPAPTTAAWTDAVPVTGVALRAYTVPKPVITGCTAALGSVTVTWTAVTSPYALTYRAVVAETGQALAVTANGTSRSATYATAQLGINTTQTVQVTAALPATPSWVSAPASQTVRIALLGLNPSCGAAS